MKSPKRNDIDISIKQAHWERIVGPKSTAGSDHLGFWALSFPKAGDSKGRERSMITAQNIGTVTLDKVFDISETQFPHLENKSKNSAHLLGLL